MLSPVQLFVTHWTVACQAPHSMELSRQEYWSGLPFPSPTRESEVAQSSLRDPWDFPGKSTAVGCHFLRQARLPRVEEKRLPQNGQRQKCLCPSLALHISHCHCLSTSPHFISDSFLRRAQGLHSHPPTPARFAGAASPRDSSYSPWRM